MILISIPLFSLAVTDLLKAKKIALLFFILYLIIGLHTVHISSIYNEPVKCVFAASSIFIPALILLTILLQERTVKIQKNLSFYFANISEICITVCILLIISIGFVVIIQIPIFTVFLSAFENSVIEILLLTALTLICCVPFFTDIAVKKGA
jgi:hypothetical protein